MAALPSGTVTFLFTDIEGSTTRWEHQPEAMRTALARHDALVRAAIYEHNGHVVKTMGDAFHAVFDRAPDAVAAALDAQRRLQAEPWSVNGPLRVRMAVHTGAAEERDGDYYGPPLNRAARLMSAGHGGQVLLSQSTYELIRDSPPSGVGLTDLGEHRLKDLIRPERVFQVTAPDLPAGFPPLVSLDVLPNNLPRQLTSFIGREHEMADVKRLLAATSLLTLVGTGGAGKTRLALQVAADVLEAYRDGAWLVELAPLTDPALVPQVVAAALGVREQAGRPLSGSLAEYLRTRSTLLLLDNCEHLITAIATLSEELLRACPGLRILATSREPLGIAGEATWRVPSLSLPDLQHLRAAGAHLATTISQYEAVRLFIDRALAAQPTFSVTNQNAPAVAHICGRLDGIPLAIELAAARVTLLGVEQIATRLDDRFRLLTGGHRTALPRQQTLRALVDWSHDLLSEPERVLWRRLSVFAGGWTLEAAEAVCADQDADLGVPGTRNQQGPPAPGTRPLHPEDMLDALAGLVDKSIVLPEEHGTSMRYHLLETLRQYGAEKLRAAGEEEQLRQRHRDWFVEFLEHEVVRLSGPEQADVFARLRSDHDNLRAAIDWCMREPSGWDTASRMADHLAWFWSMQRQQREARERLEKLLGLVRDRTAARARTLSTAGFFAHHFGDYSRAAALLAESLAIWREVGDERGLAIALARFGQLEQSRGDYDRAWSLLHESRAVFGRSGGESGLDGPLSVYLAQVAKNRGDHERAIPLFEECLVLARARGDRHAAASALRSLGELTQLQGNYERAAAFFKESLNLVREIDDVSCEVVALNRLAALATDRRQPARAARLFGAAETLQQAAGTVVAPAIRSQHERAIAAVRAQLDEGAFAAAFALGQAMTIEQAIVYALEESAAS